MNDISLTYSKDVSTELAKAINIYGNCECIVATGAVEYTIDSIDYDSGRIVIRAS